MAVSSNTMQVRLRTKRGHFDYSSKMTRFTQSSPHFGCKLNVGYGLESWAGFFSEYKYAIAIFLHQLCNPIVLLNEIYIKSRIVQQFLSPQWEYTHPSHKLQLKCSLDHIKHKSSSLVDHYFSNASPGLDHSCHCNLEK